MTPTPTTYEVVHVVVPAHNEEELLGECLSALRVAVHQLTVTRPGVHVRLTVVADRCSDDTARRARELGADVVEVDLGRVGPARQAGVRRVEEVAAEVPAERVWVANTDADTVVPAHWLSRQLDLAEAGYALVLGTVSLEGTDIDPDVLRDWHAAHTLEEGHPHVHGANLGVSLATLRSVGGFAPVEVGEDVLLAQAVRRADLPWCATATTQVRTSARLLSRVDAGFAGVLRGLHQARLGL